MRNAKGRTPELMRKYGLFLFLGLLFLSPVSAEPPSQGRALFVTVLQDPQVLSSRKAIQNLVHFAKKARMQDLFIQVYRANKAWFSSKVGDSTPYQENLKRLGEDSFQLLIEEAHRAGLKVHAWINLLSLSANQNAPLLKKYGPEILTQNLKEKKTLEDYKIDSQYFLEPGDPRVREELSNLVGEILAAYPALDGIQFDYVRYPDRNPFYGYTEINLKRFEEATGLKNPDESQEIWKDWRRDQVTKLLEILDRKARSHRPNLRVSATGCMPYIRAFHEAFQDWPSWLTDRRVDFVTAMSYVRTSEEFERYVTDLKKRVPDFKKVILAVGAYKLMDSPEEFKKEFRFCEASGAGGCVILHYGSLLEATELQEPLRP